MKKEFIYISIISIFLMCYSVNAKTDEKILFRDIPWFTSCDDVEKKYLILDYTHLEGEWSVTCSDDEIVYGHGIDFENNDINIHSYASQSSIKEINVAGYTPTGIDLYYSYDVSYEKIHKSTSTSHLYAAQYEFEPQNLDEMKADIINKLTSLYGEADESTEEVKSWSKRYCTYTSWYGALCSKVVLVTSKHTNENDPNHSPDSLRIVYLSGFGDRLLTEADKALSDELKNNEALNYGSDNTDGL